VNVFHAIGVAQNAGMGLFNLTWNELSAYCNLSRVNLTAWESQQVINMSREYCSWVNKGKDPNCGSPWVNTNEDAIEENRALVAEKMASMRNKKTPQ
jgi:hypothetical protein